MAKMAKQKKESTAITKIDSKPLVKDYIDPNNQHHSFIYKNIPLEKYYVTEIKKISSYNEFTHYRINYWNESKSKVMKSMFIQVKEVDGKQEFKDLTA